MELTGEFFGVFGGRDRVAFRMGDVVLISLGGMCCSVSFVCELCSTPTGYK